MIERFLTTMLLYINFLSPNHHINNRDTLLSTIMEKDEGRQIPFRTIPIGSSLIGVILVSPIISTSFLYFLLGTWVLQTIVILTLYRKNVDFTVGKHISEE